MSSALILDLRSILGDLDRQAVFLGERVQRAAAGPPGKPCQGWIVGTEARMR